MPVNIVIVGLGQIGASFGLALGEKKDLVQRAGYDQEIKIARQAEKLGQWTGLKQTCRGC